MTNPKDPFADLESQTQKSKSGSGLGLLLAIIVVILAGVAGSYYFLNKKSGNETAAVVQVEKPQAVTQQQPAATQQVAPAQQVAQQQSQTDPNAITICSGPAKGAFERVVLDINGLGAGLTIRPTTGAGDNLTYLHSGQCQYGLINSDDYWGRLNAGNDNKIKDTRVVMGLFEAVVHMVAVDPLLAKFSQTEGKRVGVTGGSVATFNSMIVPKTGMNFDVVAYNSTADLADALAKGKIDMIVMVGAKPQPWLKDLSLKGAHLVEFDRFEKMGELMTGNKNGFLGKRPVGPVDYPNLGDKPVMQLTTRTVLATTKLANEDPKVATKTKEIFQLLSNNISGLRQTGHDSWKTVTTMNDPGGLPWATIR